MLRFAYQFVLHWPCIILVHAVESILCQAFFKVSSFLWFLCCFCSITRVADLCCVKNFFSIPLTCGIGLHKTAVSKCLILSYHALVYNALLSCSLFTETTQISASLSPPDVFRPGSLIVLLKL